MTYIVNKRRSVDGKGADSRSKRGGRLIRLRMAVLAFACQKWYIIYNIYVATFLLERFDRGLYTSRGSRFSPANLAA